MSNTRALYVCAECLERAEWQTESEGKSFSALTAILMYLDSELDMTSSRNKQLLSTIMHKLASSLNGTLNQEIQTELKSHKTHQNLKNESVELVFLSKPSRSSVLIQTLIGFANLDLNFPLEKMTPKKLYALCTAYEAVLSLKHSLVTTAPAVMRNIQLYKSTHSRDLLESVGSPSGGKPTMLSSIMNGELPHLKPPNNDFCSCDDNLQVKRVVSSSKLKEDFKHSVKVVNSHVYFQNGDDKKSNVLTNEANQPKNWLKFPTKADVEEFERKVISYENEARKVRTDLTAGWLAEELRDVTEHRDPVTKLGWLRRSRPGEHILYPCSSCGGEGIHILHWVLDKV